MIFPRAGSTEEPVSAPISHYRRTFAFSKKVERCGSVVGIAHHSRTGNGGEARDQPRTDPRPESVRSEPRFRGRGKAGNAAA
jgi:hypothetical protein